MSRFLAEYTPQAQAQNHAMEHYAPRTGRLGWTGTRNPARRELAGVSTRGRLTLGPEVMALLAEPVWAERAGVPPGLTVEKQHDAGWALWNAPDTIPPRQRLAAGVLAHGISYRDPACWVMFLRCLGALDLPRAQELARRSETPYDVRNL